MPDRWTGDPNEADGPRRAEEENPFAASRVRPGALPYFFPQGLSAAALVERLRQSAWRGQIIGPHGSGKSTLLCALVPHLEAAGLKVRMHTLRQRERRLPREAWRDDCWTSDALLVIDGFEQLARLERWRIAWRCRRTGCGLLATAHRDVGLRTLCRTETSPELTRRLVAELTALRGAVNEQEIDRCYRAAQGHLHDRRGSVLGPASA
jgi:hypothetical protein